MASSARLFATLTRRAPFFSTYSGGPPLSATWSAIVGVSHHVDRVPGAPALAQRTTDATLEVDVAEGLQHRLVLAGHLVDAIDGTDLDAGFATGAVVGPNDGELLRELLAGFSSDLGHDDPRSAVGMSVGSTQLFSWRKQSHRKRFCGKRPALRFAGAAPIFLEKMSGHPRANPSKCDHAWVDRFSSLGFSAANPELCSPQKCQSGREKALVTGQEQPHQKKAEADCCQRHFSMLEQRFIQRWCQTAGLRTRFLSHGPRAVGPIVNGSPGRMTCGSVPGRPLRSFDRGRGLPVSRRRRFSPSTPAPLTRWTSPGSPLVPHSEKVTNVWRQRSTSNA